MPRGRLRVALAAVVAVAVVGAATVAVVERRRRQSLEERVARLEEQRRASPATGAGDAEQDRPPSGSGGDDGDDLLGRLLEAFGGGAGGVLDGSFLEDCASVLAGAGQGGGLGSLFGGATTPADPTAQLRDIAADLEEIRELRFRRVPEPVYLSPEELRRRVRDEVSRELSPEVAAGDARVLIALGALPAGADLRALTLQALGEQVAGFYDPAGGELVVGRATSGSEKLDGPARMVLAHELDHALTDQVLDLPVDDGRPPPGAEDAALARLTLVEGDATLAMQLYGLRHVGLLEQLGGLSGALASQEQLSALPHHLQRSLTFPYLQGLSFACRLHADGGWAAVDRAYDEPPATTAQVLFPERYAAREAAVDVRDPSPPEGGWEAEPTRAFGAAELLWLLEAPGGDPDRALDDELGRVRAWAGGELHVWGDGERTAAALVLAQRADQPTLCATMAAWQRAAFPGARPVAAEQGEELALDGAAGDAVLRCAGADVRVGLGPDVAVARAVAR